MILIFHNILWSKYKGGVFSALHTLAKQTNTDVAFTQIAESESDRIGLSSVDLSYHRYPYKLLFKGSYSDIPKTLLIKTLFKDVLRSQANFVLLPGYHTLEYWAMLLAARLSGKKVGVFCDSTSYDRPNSFVKGVFKRIFFSQCDVFFGYGQRSREYLISHGAPAHKIHYRCQAAALPHNYNISNVLAQRALVDINHEQRFLYVGRLSPEKNLEDLVCAFKSVVDGYSDARLIIVGSGPEKSKLVSLATQLGLINSVEFTGSKDVNALREEYLKACCLVLPSSSEPWGLVVNEALSYGCPVIVSHRCGCVPELVQDGSTGLVFECSNVADLAAKLIAVPSVFVDTSATAQRCIDLISSFSPDAAAHQILNGCHDIMEDTK